MTPPLPETDVLKPADPAIQDDNDWPEFSLTNTSITDASDTIASLLIASPDNPVTVTGRLERLTQDQIHLVHHRDILPAVLSVTNVTKFAYGQYDDGEVAFWAAGQAGWFKIRPGRAYKEVHQGMLEAVGALYFTADFYRGLMSKGARGRNVMKTVAVRDLFAKYAEHGPHNCTSTDAAERLFLYHKTFLIGCMTKNEGGIKWKQTTLLPFLIAATTMEGQEELTPVTPRTPDSIMSDLDSVDYTKRLAGKGKSVLRPRSSLHPAKGPCPATSPLIVIEGQGNSRTQSGKPPVSEGRLRQLAAARESRLQKLARHKSEASILVAKPAGYELETTSLSSAQEEDMDDSVLSPNAQDQDDDTIITLAPPPYAPSVRSIRNKSITAKRKASTLSTNYNHRETPEYHHSTMSTTHSTINQAPSFEDQTQSQTQLNLIYKEERPYLPVGNLLKKIRQIAAGNVNATLFQDLGNVGVVLGDDDDGRRAGGFLEGLQAEAGMMEWS